MRAVTSAGIMLTVVAVGAGCATIASGTTQSISVSSNVDGAALYLDGEQIGTTPYTGEVAKGRNTLRVEAEGYRPETVTLSTSLEPIFWGNIIIGGTLGSITDFASGAAYQYAPATYQVELQSNQQTQADYELQLAVRKFSMLYIDEISRDLGTEGGGEYLTALIALVEEHSGESVDADDIGSALTTSRGYPVEFGERMVALQ